VAPATDPAATTDTSNSSGLTDNQQAAAALPDAFSQLGDYLTQLQSMLNQMMASFNPDSQGSLQSWVAKQQHPEQSDQQVNQFVSFNQRMQQALAMLSGSQSTPADQATQTTTPVDSTAS
jgi:Sec-independent protein translocase protein TatA